MQSKKHDRPERICYLEPRVETGRYQYTKCDRRQLTNGEILSHTSAT
jgi:hypothetical protein